MFLFKRIAILALVHIIIIVTVIYTVDCSKNCEVAKNLNCSCTSALDSSDSSKVEQVTVSCESADLNGIPVGLGSIDILRILHDEIVILDSVNEYPDLISLDMNYDGLRLISDYSFANLTRLASLDLSYNHIIDLTAETFKGLTALELLSLKNNKIYLIETGIFTNDTFSRLATLYLNHNKIVKVERAAFRGLTNLRYLDLTMNRIEILEVFASEDYPLVNLKFLHLGINRISKIPENFFEQMPNLEQLHLENNYLTSISSTDFRFLEGSLQILKLEANKINEVKSKCFQSMTELQEINLSYNQLTQLKMKTLPYRTDDPSGIGYVAPLNLLISHNLMNCSDCENAWVLGDDRLKMNSKEDLFCQYPEVVNFENLTHSVFQHCQSGAAHMRSVTIFLVLLLVITLFTAGCGLVIFWLRNSRRRNHLWNSFSGESAGPGGKNPSSASPVNGSFSYRGLEEQFPFSIDEAEDSRI